jgi:hypothetical protein
VLVFELHALVPNMIVDAASTNASGNRIWRFIECSDH